MRFISEKEALLLEVDWGIRMPLPQTKVYQPSTGSQAFDFTKDTLRITTTGSGIQTIEGLEENFQIDDELILDRKFITALQRMFHHEHERYCVVIFSSNVVYEVFFDTATKAAEFMSIMHKWKNAKTH